MSSLLTKKTSPFFLIVFIICCIVLLFLSLGSSQNMTVVATGNINKQPLKITLGKFQDSDCGMVIENLDYTSQVITPSGKTYFFHDHGGMAHWLLEKNLKDKATIWVMSKDTKRWIDGKKAWYSRTDTTPMGYGFGAYEHKKEGLIDFESMFLHMARGEHLNNPKIKQHLLKGDH